MTTCDQHPDREAVNVRTLFGRDFHECGDCRDQLDRSARAASAKRRNDRMRSYSQAVGQYARRG